MEKIRDKDQILEWQLVLPEVVYESTWNKSHYIRERRRFKDAKGRSFYCTSEHISLWHNMVCHSFNLSREYATLFVGLSVLSLYSGISESKISGYLKDLEAIGMVRRVPRSRKQTTVTYLFKEPLGEDEDWRVTHGIDEIEQGPENTADEYQIVSEDPRLSRQGAASGGKNGR